MTVIGQICVGVSQRTDNHRDLLVYIKYQMSLEHPYGVSVSCKNLLPPPQSTSFLPLPKEDSHSKKLVYIRVDLY